MRPPVLAIVGPGDGATPDDQRHAEMLGRLAALTRWIVITGGVASGVMQAAARGARAAGGTVVGILPSADRIEATPDLTVAIVTAMGQARNNVIVLSSDAVAVCGISPGTAVEAALALRAAKPVVFIAADDVTRRFFQALAPSPSPHFVDSAEEAMNVLAPRMGQRP